MMFSTVLTDLTSCFTFQLLLLASVDYAVLCHAHLSSQQVTAPSLSFQVKQSCFAEVPAVALQDCNGGHYVTEVSS